MENFNDTNTPLFSFNGLNGMSRIVDITDGDTIKAIINFKDNYYKIIVRLNDIDTCETKSKCEENKNLGIDAKKRLYNLITDKTIDGNDKKLIKQELLNEISYRRFNENVSKVTPERKITRALHEVTKRIKEIEQVKLEMNENVIKFAEHCQNYFK